VEISGRILEEYNLKCTLSVLYVTDQLAHSLSAYKVTVDIIHASAVLFAENNTTNELFIFPQIVMRKVTDLFEIKTNPSIIPTFRL